MLRVHRCEACGSARLRRARSHGAWQRTVRGLTPLERYACGDCHHKGWRLPVPESKKLDQRDLGLTARPREARDQRMDVHLRRMIVQSVGLAVALGVLLALLLAAL